MLYLWFCTVLLLVPCVYCVDSRKITVGIDDYYFNWPSDEVKCTPNEIQKYQVIINETGIGLAVFINETNLYPDNEEYIAISREPDNSGANSSVVYITGNHENIAIAVPLVSESYITFHPGKVCDDTTNFTIILKAYEEAPPVLPVTTPNPNPPSGIRTDIRVYLAGKTLSEFNNTDFLNNFKSTIQKAAIDFCKRNNYLYDEDKEADKTVFLKSLATCSAKWPDNDRCVTGLMSVFVSKSRIDYELTITHLEQFWDEIEDKGLPVDLGVQVYDFPGVSEEIGWRILWILIALAITLVVGAVFWTFERNAILEKRNRTLPQEAFPDVEFRRKNHFTLKLPKHQKIPDYMLADATSVESTPPPVIDEKPKLNESNAPSSKAPRFIRKPILPPNSKFLDEDDEDDIEMVTFDKKD